MMDERERREFDAGLSEEVDAWLRGDTSRREFLTRLMLMGGAAMLPGLGYTASGSKAWAAAADDLEGRTRRSRARRSARLRPPR